MHMYPCSTALAVAFAFTAAVRVLFHVRTQLKAVIKGGKAIGVQALHICPDVPGVSLVFGVSLCSHASEWCI